MLFNPKYGDDVNRAKVYFDKLIEGSTTFELKKKNKRRNNSQNAYLHKLFALFGIEFGLDIEEAKQVVKVALGYTYEKKGKTFLSKTSKMDTKELSIFIDKFRALASKQGCYLPTADEYNGRYEYYENQIEINERYL